MEVLMQLLGENPINIILSVFILMLFFFIYPRLLLFQIMTRLEKTSKELEEMTDKAKRLIIKEIGNQNKEVKEAVNRFFEFFVVPPVSLDPAGIIHKLDFIIRQQRERFEYFVNQISTKADAEKKANIIMGLAGGIALYEIAKIVKHYIEFIKKTKSYQIAMILQMQIPLIEKMSRALYSGTKSFLKGEPVGDSIGPLVAAKLIGSKKAVPIEKDIVMAKTTIMGRNVFVLKAKGPGGRLGDPGKAVEKVAKKYKISRIITIDAAAKLEGEETGSIAEGVGVAMGGPGVEKTYIENVAVKSNIPLDSIIVKMSPEEAIMPMNKKIKNAAKRVIESVNRYVRMSRKGENIIIVGVGNTSGIGNSSKEAEEAEKLVEARERKKAKKGK